MKKTVLTFGLISGAVLSALMLMTLPFQDAIGHGNLGMIVGYTTMVLAFLFVFFGVRSYRDNVAGGTVRFGRAFAVGALIAGVASLCYVATWEVYYYTAKPDFIAEYQAYQLEKERANGATPEALARKKVELDNFAELYKNPAINAAMTLLEPLPVALIVALVSAGALSRKKREGENGMVAARAST